MKSSAIVAVERLIIILINVQVMICYKAMVTLLLQQNNSVAKNVGTIGSMTDRNATLNGHICVSVSLIACIL